MACRSFKSWLRIFVAFAKSRAKKMCCPKFVVQLAPFLGAIAAVLYYNFVYMSALLPLTCNIAKINCPTYSFDKRVVAKQFEPVVEIYKNLFTSGLDSRSCVFMSGLFVQHRFTLANFYQSKTNQCLTFVAQSKMYQSHCQSIETNCKLFTLPQSLL